METQAANRYLKCVAQLIPRREASKYAQSPLGVSEPQPERQSNNQPEKGDDAPPAFALEQQQRGGKQEGKHRCVERMLGQLLNGCWTE